MYRRPGPAQDSALPVGQARPLLLGLRLWRCSSCGIPLLLVSRPPQRFHNRCLGWWTEMTRPAERLVLLRILTQRML